MNNYVIKAMVRKSDNDDFVEMFAGYELCSVNRAVWYTNHKCATFFCNAGEARKFFAYNKDRLICGKHYSVALDSIKICRIKFDEEDRINVV